MSSTIAVIAVQIENLRGAAGSQDRKLLAAVLKGQEEFLKRIDEIDEEAEFTCADAVEALIEDQVSDDMPGYLYGYALEALCRHLGTELPEVSPIVGATEWIEGVDAVLERKGVPLRLNMLVYGTKPVEIPEPDDYPFIGQWPADILPGALAALRRAGISDLDANMAETVEQIRGWVEEGVKVPGVTIVGFLS